MGHHGTVSQVGTGATACQCVPELADVASELYVFQRTPSSIDVRNNYQTSDEKKTQWENTEGWAMIEREKFDESMGEGRARAERLAKRKASASGPGSLSREEINEKKIQSNFRSMEQIRQWVDSVVDDPATAELLKPYCTNGCASARCFTTTTFRPSTSRVCISLARTGRVCSRSAPEGRLPMAKSTNSTCSCAPPVFSLHV